MKNKEKYEVGQTLELTMLKPVTGKKRPISKHDGIICLISYDCKGFYEYYSVWSCEIIEIHENKLIIKPVFEIQTASETTAIIDQIYKDLTPIKEKKQKVKKKFPFFGKNVLQH